MVESISGHRLLAAACAISVAVAACGTSVASPGEPAVIDGTAKGLITDFGVSDDYIRVGLIPDLSGPLSGITTPLIDAQLVFWDRVNAEGGIEGRMIEPIVLDNAYEVAETRENYDSLADEGPESVVMISHVTGTPHNAAIAQKAKDDDMVVVPFSWYSGWADPEFGGAHFELHANYCVESMNGVEFLQQKVVAEGKDPKLAVLSYPGEYGQDGAAGAKLGAQALGIEVAYDGDGQILAGQDPTAVVSRLIDSGATMVWITAGPADLGAIFGAAVDQGVEASWSGNSQTFNPSLLGGKLGQALDQFYTHSTYTSLFGSNDTPGMEDMIAAITAERPDDKIQDVYVWGWTEGMFARAVLEQAAASGDMTRAGVAGAAREVNVDFQGLAPDQNWTGDPNDFIVRETYMYDVDLAAFNQISLADYAGLDDKSTAGSGLTAVDGFAPFTSASAAAFEFTDACFGGG